MQFRLAVWAAAKVREARSASRALSVPILNDRSTAKRGETTANDRLLHFMGQLRFGRKRTTSLKQRRKLSLKYSLSARAEDCLGSNRRFDDVRCMTGVPLKAEVWPRVCYVAEVPHPDSRTAANCVPHPTRYKVAPGVPRRCARV